MRMSGLRVTLFFISGYSLISNPYWALPFEVLEGVTTGLLVASAIIYGAKLSNKSNIGTMQGILATSHYGFGKIRGLHQC